MNQTESILRMSLQFSETELEKLQTIIEQMTEETKTQFLIELLLELAPFIAQKIISLPTQE